MVVVGTDARKYSHAFVAADERWVANSVRRPSRPGCATAIMWARGNSSASADLRHRGLPQHVGASWAYGGPTNGWCGYPPSVAQPARSRGKSDPIDARWRWRGRCGETDTTGLTRRRGS